jgi:DNA-binding HxlR family transcriptional regulator
LTGSTSNGSGNEERSGAQTLLLLAAPLNAAILRALAGGAMQLAELRRQTGAPAQTTLRAQLKRLVEIGVAQKHRRNRFPGVLEYELTPAGAELLPVADVLERWLQIAPQGPLRLDESPAKASIKALADGWSTTILRALAAGPLSLTELDRLIGTLTYPSLQRRLGALRLAGQIEARPGTDRGTPYAVTDWLRQGVAPLAAAGRWERRHRSQLTPQIGRLEVEAAFLLTLPLLRPSSRLTGSCRLAVRLSNGAKEQLAGVTAEIADGAMTACATELDGKPGAWAQGSAAAWLDAVIEHDVDSLELGGDRSLAGELIEGLHAVLFQVRVQAR